MALKNLLNNGIDFEEIDQRYKIIFSLILVIVALFFFKDAIVQKLNPYELNKEWRKLDFEKHFSGVVIKKGKDKSNHGFLYFQLKDSTKIFEHMIKIYPNVAVGDSVLKQKNSMLLYIYKPDTTLILNYEDIFKYRDSLTRTGN